MTTAILAISGITIKQDLHGRFCLNDLHKAAGGEKRHRPNYWLDLQGTKDLVEFLDSEKPIAEMSAIFTKQGLGTFVVKELVYSYAMWISAKFQITVIRAYDAMVNAKPYGLKELPVEKISPAQRQEIRHIIANKSGSDSKAYQTLYWELHEHFKVNSYKEINACDFEKAIEFLTGKKSPQMVTISVDELEALRSNKLDRARFIELMNESNAAGYVLVKKSTLGTALSIVHQCLSPYAY